MKPRALLLIGVGGALGTALRYFFVLAMGSAVAWPMGIFAANIIGAALIGAFFGIAPRLGTASTSLRLIFATGFLGGLTTLSSLAVALATQLDHHLFLAALGYFLGTAAAGVAACFLALTAVRRLEFRREREDG